MIEALRGRLVVSCQAPEGDAFRDSESIARFAAAAVRGGAAGIRAAGAEDVRAIRASVSVPIIGIEKCAHPDGRILITPSFEGASALVGAGADMIAIDCTLRGQQYGALERLKRIKQELQVPVFADIATADEARAAAEAGADAVLSTMRGYTDQTAGVSAFEPQFIAELLRAVTVPVIAEGRIDTPEMARTAMHAGAWCVIVGTAITRPVTLTERFVAAVESSRRPLTTAAIDLGGTNTKAGIISGNGTLAHERTVPTPGGGREVLLGHLQRVAEQLLGDAPYVDAIGIATAGWVDPFRGQVAYATENLPGWSGTEIAARLRESLGVPVAVENDANALALAEQHFGAGRGVRHFICLTLGTGVGGGCCVDGRLNRGAHFFANALGHISIDPEGLPCTCGGRGCLEQYANAAALVRYAGSGQFRSAEQVITAANAGDDRARAAVRQFSRYLAQGCATFLHVLDPELIILSGGVAQENPLLIGYLREELAARTMIWRERRVRLEISALGYYGGVYGAAAIARQLLSA